MKCFVTIWLTVCEDSKPLRGLGVDGYCTRVSCKGEVTQLVECQTENLVVSSSNLLFPTKISSMSALINKFNDLEF